MQIHVNITTNIKRNTKWFTNLEINLHVSHTTHIGFTHPTIKTHNLKSSSNDMRFFIERKIKVSTRLNFNPSDLESKI